MNLFDVICDRTQSERFRTAILEGATDWDYSRLIDTAERVTQHILKNVATDPAHPPRLALLAKNSADLAAWMLAMARLKGVIVLLTPSAGENEWAADIKRAGVTHVVVSQPFHQKIRLSLRNNWLSEIPVLEFEKVPFESYDGSLAVPKPFQRLPDETYILLATQGLILPRRFVPFSAHQIEPHIVALRDALAFTQRDRTMTSLPWAHPFALTHAFWLPLLTGASLAIAPTTTGKPLVEFLIGAHLTRIADHPRGFLELLTACRAERFTLPGMTNVIVGLGPLSTALRKIFGMLRISAVHCLGQTENLWTIAMENPEEASAMGSIRLQPLPAIDFALLEADGTDSPLAPSQTGILATKSPWMMKGYERSHIAAKNKLELQAIEEEAGRLRPFDSKGRFVSNDIVRIDREKKGVYVSFMGRREDCLFLGRTAIPGYLLDTALKSVPGVIEGAGFPIVTSEGKPALGCAIVKEEAIQLTPNTVLAILTKLLPPQMVPEQIRFLHQLPRDLGGNVLRSQLRSLIPSLSPTPATPATPSAASAP